MDSDSNSYGFYNVFLKTVLNFDFLSNLINISLYQSDFSIISGGGNDNNISKNIKKFLYSLNKEIMNGQNLDVSPKLKLVIKLAIEILDLKENISTRYIGYDNIYTHFPNLDYTLKRIIDEVIENKIKDKEQFTSKLDDLLREIEIYNSYVLGMTPFLKKIGAFSTSIEQGGIGPSLFSKYFKDIITDTNNVMVDIPIINKEEKHSDYMILGSEGSTKKVAKSLVGFLKETYNRYKTGYPIIDDSSGGIESGSVTIISGPSNHAKSIFMINILKNVIEENEWKEDDAILMVTLEDDIYKLLSRIISIFGNYNAKEVKNGYQQTSYLVNDNPDLEPAVIDFWYNQVKDSIASITKNKCELILQQSKENTFSVSDVNKIIDNIKERDGKNVKFVAIDYLDVNNCVLNSLTAGTSLSY